ncbi:MAG: hypothetical protein HY260_17310 [Chloroflexi bacterium]|nr:hypothetical protein [Chloroflexota bacterium]
MGGWWCLGEVRNTTGGPVTNVAVQIAMSAPGETGTTATAFAALDFIPPGASVPFGALFAGTPSGTPSAGTPQSDPRAEGNRTYKALLLSAESADGLADRYAWFDVADTRLARAGELITLAGTVRNDRSDEVNRIVLVATVYDAVGQVTGFRIQSLAGSLPSGGSLPFEFQFSPAGGEAATFAVVAQGRRASP